MTLWTPQPNRRAALAGLSGLAALWAVPTIASAQAAKATTALTWTPTSLTPTQARTLEAAADVVMPATDTPGARDAGVAASIDRWMGDYLPQGQVQDIRAGLDRLEADARAQSGAAFAALPLDRQTAMIARYDAESRAPASSQPIGRGDTETGLSNRPTAPPATPARAFFPLIRELVTVAYFTSQPGATKAVRYDPVPGAYHGCVPLSQIGRAWAI
jgi:hypothetical protein